MGYKNLPPEENSVGNPTQTKLRFILDHTANVSAGFNDSHFIDLAKALSQVNRRAYRQGLWYHISSITVHDSNQDAWVKFATAPHTWTTKNAWVRGFRAWSRMNSKAAENLGDDLEVAGKFHDFKVYLNQNHREHVINGVDVVNPIGSADFAYSSNTAAFANYIDMSQQYPGGDWEYSEFRTMDPPSDPTDIILMGGHDGGSGSYNAYSLLQGYMETKNKQPEIQPTQDSDIEIDYIANLFDSSDEFDDIIDDMTTKNDEKPYAHDLYNTDTALQAQAACSAGAGSVARTGGFMVPCGLLEVITNANTDGKVEIVIEMTAGNYNGVAAARMC